MKPRHLFLIIIYIFFITLCSNVQGQVNESIIIDTIFDYSNYYKKIVPIIGKAVQTITSIGFNVNLISFKNHVLADDKNDEVAEVRFAQKEFNFGNDPFKKCLLFHFDKREYYEEFNATWASSWKGFCATIPQDGHLLLIAIMMDDSLETQQYLTDFLTFYNNESDKLPNIFFDPIDVLDFVYKTTISELRINSNPRFSPTFQRIYYLRKPEYFATDTISRASFTNTECIEINGKTTSGFDFKLCIFNSKSEFMIPINPYPYENKETEILEEAIIKFRDSSYKRLKVKTTIQPEQILLGMKGVHCTPAVYGYDYISILKIGGFSFQLTNNCPNLNNKASEIPYYQSEIDSLFNLVCVYFNK